MVLETYLWLIDGQVVWDGCRSLLQCVFCTGINGFYNFEALQNEICETLCPHHGSAPVLQTLTLAKAGPFMKQSSKKAAFADDFT